MTGEPKLEDTLEVAARREIIGDRYEVLALLGGGAMGVVYEALDRQLDRKVALKFLRQQVGQGVDEFAQRMLREAKALARISHPNVVVVHDFGVHQDRVYLVMEIVRGTTLTSWQQGRPWREVLTAYVQAGAGLAAAHGAGVVHRDFKPDNVLVSDDGRVRVSDFGIARLDDPSVGASLNPSPVHAPPLLPPQLTHDGAVLGTPAYMSPEQFEGRASDARSDQFAFCVALFEALAGTRPFEGHSYSELREQVCRGAAKKLPPSFPRRLERALRRGLQADPSKRWPELGALLAQLELVLRPRRTWVVAAALVVAVGALAAPALLKRASLCTGAAGQIDGPWNPAVRAEVKQAFLATGSVVAEPSFEHAAALADAYRATWVRTATEACEAAQLRGEQSEDIYTARTICLERELELFSATTRLWRSADRNVVVASVNGIRLLPQPAECTVEAAKASGASQLPLDPRARQVLDELGRQVVAATPLLTAGRPGDARALLTPLSGAVQASGWQPLIAEHALALSRAHLGESHIPEAEASALDAVDAAERSGDATLTARARLGLSAIVAVRRMRSDDGRRLLRSAAVAIERAGQPLALQAELAEQRGDFAFELGRVPEAHTAFLEALAFRERAAGPDDVSAAQALLGLARVAISELALEPEWEQRLERALKLQRAAFGERHPEVARTLRYRGILLFRQKKKEGIAQLRAAVEMHEQTAGDSVELASALASLGQTLAEDGQLDEARTRMEQALALQRRFLEPDHPFALNTLMNLGVLSSGQGEPTAAFAKMDEVLPLAESRFGRDSGKWAMIFLNWCGIGFEAGKAADISTRCTAEPARVAALIPDYARVQWEVIQAMFAVTGGRFAEGRRLFAALPPLQDPTLQEVSQVFLHMADLGEKRDARTARAWLERRATEMAARGKRDGLFAAKIRAFLSEQR